MHLYAYFFVCMYEYVCIHTGHERVPGVAIENQYIHVCIYLYTHTHTYTDMHIYFYVFVHIYV